MNRLFVPTLGPTDWRRLLADPGKQWVAKQSALESAVCWEGARETTRGLPADIANAVDSAADLRGAELLLAIPEHKVQFDGGGHASQNDVWALLRVKGGIASLTVEAKAGEPLDALVADWRKSDNPRTRKPDRLVDVQTRLGISKEDVDGIRYQLLHRTASALKEAERFGAHAAVMLIHSFSSERDRQSYDAFSLFCALMQADAGEGKVARSDRTTVVPLFLGWVSSKPAELDVLRAAV